MIPCPNDGTDVWQVEQFRDGYELVGEAGSLCVTESNDFLVHGCPEEDQYVLSFGMLDDTFIPASAPGTSPPIHAFHGEIDDRSWSVGGTRWRTTGIG